MKNQEIVVWFSCGAASAVAAKYTLEKYQTHNNVRVVNNPVAEEDADNLRFLSDVEQWLGVPIEKATNHHYPNCSAVEVWDRTKYMSGIKGAPCTLHLKKHARYQFEIDNDIDWHVLGFTADEVNRFRLFKESERSNTLPVLIDAGVTKQDCMYILASEGLEMPKMYRLGYPNANCVGCVKATSPTYWNAVRKTHPQIFAERAEQSRRLGAKLVRVSGERIFLDELDPDQTGRPLKSLELECGVWCHTGENELDK